MPGFADAPSLELIPNVIRDCAPGAAGFEGKAGFAVLLEETPGILDLAADEDGVDFAEPDIVDPVVDALLCNGLEEGPATCESSMNR